VFRDRYKTQKILHENHLKNCIVYIHKNPIEARMIQNEEEYVYSSYNEYIKNSEQDIRLENYLDKDLIKFEISK